jgi:cell volume regulation protein A
MHVENLIILVCSTLLLSYLSSLIYSYTKIPDVIWLMGFGVIMGSGTQYLDRALFNELAPLMSILALSIILFEAGINVDIITIFENMGKAAALTVTSILSSIIIVGLIMRILFPLNFSLIEGMLLGAMIGGTSTVAVFGILGSIDKTIPIISSTRIMLVMESILSDPICIISSITLIKMIMQPAIDPLDGLSDIVTTFVLSSILGVSTGLVWSNLLNRLRTPQYIYMITLAILLQTYILSETIIGNGAGAMTALTFGISLTNYSYLMRKIGRTSKVRIDTRKLREFHEEIVFFIKSFFFVYIGVIVNISLKNMYIGFSIVIILMLMRYGLVSIIGKTLFFTYEEVTVSRVVYASGLPAFVMSQLPMIYDPNGIKFHNPGLYPDICMPIVLGTILYSGLLGPWIIRRELALNKSPNSD